MTEPTITCPGCNTEIKLTKSLAAPLLIETRRRYEHQLAQNNTEIARREEAIRQQQMDLAKERQTIEDRVTETLNAEREKIAADEARKARLIVATDLCQKDVELASLKEVLHEREVKLANAQKAQAELIRKQRELDDAKREMDLTIETRVQNSLTAVREKAVRDAEEGLLLKVREKELQIASMQRQIEDLKRKAEQGSQQLQGEVQELVLETILRGKFPSDLVQPVPKGEFGGDLLHRVVDATGQVCGTIIWETKRTKNWSDSWLPKLRDDQRAAKAEIAVIVSHVLPKSMNVSFELLDGIWVTEPGCAVPVAVALRESLIALSAARQTGVGQLTKMEMIYQYLTGPRFRLRVGAIVEKFSDMQADLERERKTMTRLWAKREEQIRSVIDSTAGMYGDLQGIAGRTLQEIEGLDTPLLGEPMPD